MTFPAIFAILVGTSMVAQWTLSYSKKQIPELQTEPIRIWFHIVAELITALCLVTAGFGLLTGQPWAVALYLVGSGMLFYTAIVSPGYFAQKGMWSWLVVFAALIVLGIGAVLTILSHNP
ncbi:MAG: hypothetical protein Kow002_17570 [Anaerolineales bacterium]